MSILKFLEQLIPGYSILSAKEIVLFEAIYGQSASGRALLIEIMQHISAVDKFSIQPTGLKWLFYAPDKNQEKQLNQQSELLILRLQASPEYVTLLSYIGLNLLYEVHPDLPQLDEDGQQSLVNSEQYQNLQMKLLPIEQKLRSPLFIADNLNGAYLPENSHEQLLLQKEELISNWIYQVSSQPVTASTASLKKEIDIYTTKQLKKHAKKLISFFPSLKEITSTEKLVSQYKSTLKTQNLSTALIEKQLISIILFQHLQKASNNHFRFMELVHFNETLATDIAELILSDFNNKEIRPGDEWVKKYTEKLLTHTKDSIFAFNNKKWQMRINETKDLPHSLSSMIRNSSPIKQTEEFLNKLSEAHAFMQATSFASQNDNCINAILDLYNTNRAAEQISETKSIFMSLLEPFKPLLDEYKDIALYEKNTYNKIFRTIMPIIVLVGFIIAISTALAFLALPEVIFIVALIPTLFLGAFLAAQYTVIKNSAYNFLRQSYYGGVYEIPEFHINERMTQPTAFKTSQNATIVRNFYISELEKCDRLELNWSSKTSGTLNSNDLEQRATNTKRRNTLWLEWYDIHSNNNLGCNDITTIAFDRLQSEIDDEIKTMEKVFNHNDLPEITLSIRQISYDIKTNLGINSPSFYPKLNRENIVQNNYAACFFKPQCLNNKARAEKLDTILSSIKI